MQGSEFVSLESVFVGFPTGLNIFQCIFEQNVNQAKLFIGLGHNRFGAPIRLFRRRKYPSKAL
jgi:hypothetical protein